MVTALEKNITLTLNRVWCFRKFGIRICVCAGSAWEGGNTMGFCLPGQHDDLCIITTWINFSADSQSAWAKISHDPVSRLTSARA